VGDDDAMGLQGVGERGEFVENLKAMVSGEKRSVVGKGWRWMVCWLCGGGDGFSPQESGNKMQKMQRWRVFCVYEWVCDATCAPLVMTTGV
jgi:hypothetical protein